MQQYKVLMVAPTSFFADYGCHVRILEEARILQQLGHAVTIVTYRNGQDVPGIRIERTLPIPWRKGYEVGASRHKIAFDLLLGLKTFALLARRRYDVIHAHLHEGALIALVLGRLFGVPTVFDFQGSMTGEMIDHGFLRQGGLAHRLLRRLETWIDRRCPAIFTSTAQARQLLVCDFGCEEERVHILQDRVQTTVFRPASDYPAEQLAALREQLGILAGCKVIVYLGLLAEYQGTDLLLQAFARVAAARPDVRLLLMGFPRVEHYRGRARELGVEERVIFTGRVPYGDAPSYLALGDVAVAPKLSLTEGSGKLLNYMAVGLPVVAFDTAVAHEYLGAEGAYAASGDVEQLARKLLGSLNEPSKAHVAGHRLRERAVRKFGWLAGGEQIVGIYQRLTGRPDAEQLAPGKGSALLRWQHEATIARAADEERD